jgi:hypothetical protein
MHARTHTITHARTHAHTHTHTRFADYKRVRESCDGYHKSFFFEIATSDQMGLVQSFRVVQAADLADDGEFARVV